MKVACGKPEFSSLFVAEEEAGSVGVVVTAVPLMFAGSQGDPGLETPKSPPPCTVPQLCSAPPPQQGRDGQDPSRDHLCQEQQGRDAFPTPSKGFHKGKRLRLTP